MVVKGPDNRADEELKRLVVTYEKELLRLCCVYLKDVQLAEDAVQETFVKAYRGFASFRGESSEKTWLVRIAINVCKDMRRGAWYRFVDRSVDFDRLEMAREERSDAPSQLMAEIMRLPAAQREVVLLYYYEGFSMKKTAQTLGVSEMTVSRRLGKARGMLKRWLEGGWKGGVESEAR